MFTDVSEESGFTETQSDLGFSGEESQGAAAAVADIDRDGDLDVFLPRVGKPNGLYVNDGEGGFTDIAADVGVGGPIDRFGSAASAFLDIEGDGDLDLFAAGAAAGSDQLLVNDGTGHFTDEAATRGLDRPVAASTTNTQQHGVTVADVNLDGHMDLLVLQWRFEIFNQLSFGRAEEAGIWERGASPTPCETAAGTAAVGFPLEPGTPPGRSALYLNDGTGRFADVTEEYGLALDDIVAFTGVFNDVDGDRWPDLAITGDGCTSHLYRNVEGTGFENITEEAGVGTDENGMGSVVRDIDGDGTPDWFITSIYLDPPEGEICPGSSFVACSGNRLYLNDGSGSFSDGTDELGVRDTDWGWGAAIEDFSNDGQLEVVATNGFRVSDEPDPNDRLIFPFVDDPTRFFAWSGRAADSPFGDVAAQVGIDDSGVGHALVPFDMDGDGDLDLLIAQSNDTPVLYRNDTEPARSWITISLEDPTQPGNRWGDGARVVITPDADSTPIVDWVSTSGSYESQKPPTVHRGFGDRTEPLAKVEVFWPGETTPQTVTDVELDQQLDVVRAA